MYRWKEEVIPEQDVLKSGWGGKLTEGAQADMRDWFWVDSPHGSGDSSDPAAYKPSEHVGVMGERRLPHLVIMLCQDSLVILHKHIK